MVKNISIQISYDEEKLEALKVFLDEKGKTMDGELTELLNSLYEKTVPQKVQLFIEKKNRPHMEKQKAKSENKPV